MPWFTNIKPDETLIVNGARLQVQRREAILILDDTALVSKLDRNGDLIKGPQPQEANQ